jgi:hypothetical protein
MARWRTRLRGASASSLCAAVADDPFDEWGEGETEGFFLGEV